MSWCLWCSLHSLVKMLELRIQPLRNRILCLLHGNFKKKFYLTEFIEMSLDFGGDVGITKENAI